MTEYVGNSIPSPGFNRGDYANDDELLYSTARFTQKGVTLKAGQGVLLLGTVLAQDTASKQYVKYNSAGSGGANVARGVLRNSVDTGSDSSGATFQGNIVISGILKLSALSAANGGTGSLEAAITGSRVDSVIGTFTF